MMRSLILRTIYEKRWFTIGWTAALMGMIFMVILFFPSFSKDDAFANIAQDLPDALQGFIGDTSTFSSIAGYISTQLYDIRVPIFLMIMALVLAQSLSVGEEERGDLRSVLSTPMSRVRIATERWLGVVIIVLFINIGTVGGSYLGLFTINEAPPHDLIWRLAGLSFIFTMSVFSLIYSIGIASGHKGTTMAAGLMATIGSFILSSFAVSVDWLETVENFSLLHYYDASSLKTDGLDLEHVGVLITVAIVSFIIGILCFRRRDIA